MSKLADMIRVARLRRKGRWVGLRWLWNKLWSWRDAEYEAWLEQERAEARAMFEFGEVKLEFWPPDDRSQVR